MVVSCPPHTGFRNKTNYRHEGSIASLKSLTLLAIQIRNLPEGERRILARLQHEAGVAYRRGDARRPVHLRHELVGGLRIEIVDVIAEMDRAVRAFPAGEIDPRHRDRPRELDRGAPAGRDLGVDFPTAEVRLLLQDPRGEIAYVMHARAARGLKAIVGREAFAMIGVVHVDRMRVRHVDAHIAERIALT